MAFYIKLTEDKLSITDVYDKLTHPHYGGTVVFQGTTRNIHHPDQSHPNSVKYLDFQAYNKMAEKELEKLAQEILKKYEKVKIVVLHHRIGICEEAEPCVYVGVASAHREQLFEACDFGICELKRRVPIWKKEIYFSNEESPWLKNCECAIKFNE